MSGLFADVRAHLSLALPLCVGHLGQQMMAFVDSAMVGHYDSTALAGFGVANALLMTFSLVGMGLVMGLDTLIPQALGAGNSSRAHALHRAGLRLAVWVGMPLTLIAGLSPLGLRAIGVHEDVAFEAEVYVYGRLPAILPFLIFAAQRSYLQALHHTLPLVIAVAVANVANVVLDAFLVFGDEALEWLGLPGIGLPALGALGASVATSLVTILMASLCGLAVARHTRTLEQAPPTRTMPRDILRLGTPVGLQLLAEVGIIATIGILAGRLGVLPGASHQIALTLASVSFAIALGMAAATSVRVGHSVGAGDVAAARSAGWVGMLCGATILGLCGILFVSMPEQLAGLFTDDAALIEGTRALIVIAAVFQLSDALQVIAAGALRGAGDNTFTFWANLVGHYGLGIWVALSLAFVFEVGAPGLWWGLSVGLTAVALALTVRFHRLTRRPLAAQAL